MVKMIFHIDFLLLAKNDTHLFRKKISQTQFPWGSF